MFVNIFCQARVTIPGLKGAEFTLQPRNGQHSSSCGLVLRRTSSLWISWLEPRPSPLFPPSHGESPFWILELSTMGTPNDQAVLQAIFNPDTPFGDIVGLDLGEEAEKEEGDEGQYSTLEYSSPHWLVCCLAGVAEVGGLTRALVPRPLDDDC